MENRHSRQNKRETTSEGEVECSAIYDRTNYHIWSLFSRKSDGLMQLDPSLKDNFVLCNGAFSDTKGNSKCSFILLSFSCHVLFDYIFFHTATIFFTFSNLKKNQSKQTILFPKLSILLFYSQLHLPHHAQL